MNQLCVYCNKDTSFGSGRFVNRVPSDGDGTRDGYACADCVGYTCNRCDKPISLDEDITPEEVYPEELLWEDGTRHVHEECLTQTEKQDYDINNTHWGF